MNEHVKASERLLGDSEISLRSGKHEDSYRDWKNLLPFRKTSE